MVDAGIPELIALRRLVAEIAAGDYRDGLRHRLVRNTAYIEATALLDLRDTLERPAERRGSRGEPEA
jgi:hypothetical protein